MMGAMPSIPRYGEYKCASLDWVNEIPDHWTVKKVFHHFFAKKGADAAMLTKEYCGLHEGKYAVYSGQTENNGVMGKINCYEFDFSEKGCLFSTTVGAKAMTVKYLDSKFSLSQNCMIIVRRENNSLFLKFSYYAFQPMFQYFRNQIPDHMQASFRMEDLYQYRTILPPKKEQISIANFLDKKTAQIDEAIAIKEKQIALLKDRKQIIIQKAITQGLNPDVPMKNSCVDWIGQIPEHWEVLANRALFSERVEKGRDGLPLLSVSIHSGVSKAEISEEENVRGRVKIEDKSKYILVKTGDIAFNMMRAWQGGIGAVSTDGMVSPAYIVAKPKPRINSEYFELQYRCPEFVRQMDRYSKGITDFRKRLYWDSFKQLNTVVPPIEEQTEIIRHVKTLSDKTEAGVSLLREQIEKLKEYKTTLINSAVTGKIKVA